MRNEPDYAEISADLKATLGLKGSPVAIKFVLTHEDIPAGIPEYPETVRHCQMVSKARKEGAIFYATTEKHQCMGGGWALGLKKLSPSLKSGEFYYKLGKFKSTAACKRTIENIPHLGEEATHALVYAPLEKTPFPPDVVLVIAEPRAMLKIAQALLYPLGGRIHSSMAGIQSVCSDATAYPYLSGKANFSLGCDGSRKFSGIEPDEMVMGLPGEMLTEVSEALKIVTGAPGSS